VIRKDQIILKPVKQPRQGWSEAFKRMHEEGDDQLLIPDVFEDEEFEEWK
jgi:antitoxin MazE